MNIVFDKHYTIQMNNKMYSLDIGTVEKLVKSFQCGQKIGIYCTWKQYDLNGLYSERESYKCISRMNNKKLDAESYFLSLLDVNNGRVKTRKVRNLKNAKKSAHHYYIEQMHDIKGYNEQIKRIEYNWNFAKGMSYGLTNQR